MTLSVRGPEGAVLHSVSVPDTDPLPQYLIFVAPAAGTYSIDVTASSHLAHSKSPETSGPRPARATCSESSRFVRPRPRWRSGSLVCPAERAVENERRESMAGLQQAVPLLSGIGTWMAIPTATTSPWRC